MFSNHICFSLPSLSSFSLSIPLLHAAAQLRAARCRDEAESLGLSLSHCRLVSGLFVFYSLLFCLTPPALSVICPHHISTGRSRSANNPLLVKLPKSRITAHLHSFIPLFSRLWNKLPHSIQSHSSLQAFKTTVHHHLLSSPIQILDLFYPR